MSTIRAKNTSPERIVRSILHKAGFRYRLHSKNLPGTPDLVLSRYRVAIFVHGCFWHAHSCRFFRMPSSNREFWEKKISANRDRDTKIMKKLLGAGWRVFIVWECALRGKRNFSDIGNQLISWIGSDNQLGELSGEG